MIVLLMMANGIGCKRPILLKFNVWNGPVLNYRDSYFLVFVGSFPRLRIAMPRVLEVENRSGSRIEGVFRQNRSIADDNDVLL